MRPTSLLHPSRASVAVAASLLLAAACIRSPVAIPDEPPFIRGVVTDVRLADGHTVVLVEERPGIADSGAKAEATLGRDARVLRHDGSRAGRDALHAGQVIRLWHTGLVLDSYPVQVGARVVVLEPAGS